MIHKHFSEELPEFLFNYDTKQPFTHCLVCHTALDSVEKYAIEKVFKNNRQMGTSEIIYEYAICLDCAADIGNEISEESLASIQQLYEEHSSNLLMKLEYLHQTDKYNLNSWIERCSFTGKEIRLCSEFSVSAMVEGGKLVYEHSPMAVSDTFMEKMQECMSQKTRDYFDGFKDKYFDLDPDLKDLINGPTVGFI